MSENSEPTFTYSKEEKATLGATLASEAKSHVWDHKAPESGPGPKVMTSADVQRHLESMNAGLQAGIRAASGGATTQEQLREQVRYAQSAEMKCPYVTCSWVSGTAAEYRVHMEGHAKRPVLSWTCACGAMGEGSVDVPYAHVRPNGGICSLQRKQFAGGGPEVGLQRQRTFTREEVLAVLKAHLASVSDAPSALSTRSSLGHLIVIFERME